jgi:ammonium transporter Rh
MAREARDEPVSQDVASGGKHNKDAHNCVGITQAIIFAILQVIIIACYGAFTTYGVEVSAGSSYANRESDSVNSYYPQFQDVHVMIFVGFGFLMTFLKAHSWTSVGFTMLAATWTIQITILAVGFWARVFHGFEYMGLIELDIVQLIIGDFGAGAVLISFGAVLGKLNAFQLLVMATVEVFFYSLNEEIGVALFQAVDMGGSMFVHTFGAVFGLAVTIFYTPKKLHGNHKLCESNYTSNIFAMIGTLFLWMFWPSFNGALATGNAQHRVIVNTVLALCCSALGAFLMSAILNKGKFDME